MKLIARKKEIEELERLYSSGRPEFVIVYGRRRIGKTYIVNRLFGDRITFSYVGDIQLIACVFYQGNARDGCISVWF